MKAKLIAAAYFGLIIAGCSITTDSYKISKLNYTQLDETNYYAFVGEKISVNQFEPEVDELTILMDAAFKSEYKILQQYKGNELPSNISFEAYDHYGYPPFAKNEVVLIYLKKYKDNFYHVKYAFEKVRPYKGDWVTCGTTYDWKGKPLLKSKFIWNGLACIKGNYAKEIIEARQKSGRFDN